MLKILHLSDTHFHRFGCNEPPVSNLLTRIDALRAYPDHLKIITGDITDDGRNDQQARVIDALDESYIFVPGNHDYGAIGSIYDPECARQFDHLAALFGVGPYRDKNPTVIKRGNVTIILLNSCLETVNPFDFACGEIGRRQTNILAGILALPRGENEIRIVALHHHPFIHNDPAMMLLDANRFLRTIYEKIDILLFGHLHESGFWRNKVGVPLILAADALFEKAFHNEITIDEGGTIEVKPINLDDCRGSGSSSGPFNRV